VIEGPATPGYQRRYNAGITPEVLDASLAETVEEAVRYSATEFSRQNKRIRMNAQVLHQCNKCNLSVFLGTAGAENNRGTLKTRDN
jgi:hypothetical protein